jgi:hypothetical protein
MENQRVPTPAKARDALLVQLLDVTNAVFSDIKQRQGFLLAFIGLLAPKNDAVNLDAITRESSSKPDDESALTCIQDYLFAIFEDVAFHDITDIILGEGFWPLQNSKITSFTTSVKSRLSLTPRYISFAMMYANNHDKMREFYYLTNECGLTEASIQEAFDEIGDYDIVPSMWSLPSLSEIAHPEEAGGPNEHCYHTMDNLTFTNSKKDLAEHTYNCCTLHDDDVYVIVDAVNNGGSEYWFKFDLAFKREEIERSVMHLEGEGYSVYSNRAEDAPESVSREQLLAWVKDSTPEKLTDLALLLLNQAPKDTDTLRNSILE